MTKKRSRQLQSESSVQEDSIAEAEQEQAEARKQKRAKLEVETVDLPEVPASVIKKIKAGIKTRAEMKEILEKYGRPASLFKQGTRINVNNRMQENYSFVLEKPMGQDFNAEFKPVFTPAQMLQMGVFEGKYCCDCLLELPKEWFLDALDKLCPDAPDELVNRFKMKSRQPLAIWKKNKWLPTHDPRGWFEWYYRYWLGRRDAEVDRQQIARWKAFARHEGQIRANCRPGDLSQRPRQRQALLQWSRNCFL